MRGGSFRAAAFAATALFASSINAQNIDPIVIKGSKFFFENSGEQFFMRGIAYQQEASSSGATGDGDDDYIDPLADEERCQRDVPFLEELRTNTIRVYAIDPEANHDPCMRLLQEAGIYVIADLSQPNLSINRDDPSWDDDLYERYTAVVDELAKYPNTLGFFAGNEVSDRDNNTAASAFVKAAVRDMKAYIRSRDYRPMGVGYATNDHAEIREDLAAYFNCGNREDSVDFWGYNIYSWCGESSFKESGFDVRTREFEQYSVPVFFAEYGCNEVQPRPFTEVEALFGPQMTDVWSGGIVYMYFQEANDYGLVEVNGDEVETLRDFDALSTQMAQIDPTGVSFNEYNPTNTALEECPPTGGAWAAVSDPLPPTPNKELCTCMIQSLSCVVDESVDEDDYGDLFGTVCGLEDGVCDGIAANATTGDFGAYGMCNDLEKLSFAFNQYALSQNNNPNACDFNGAATTQEARTAEGDCRDLLEQAGEDGRGELSSGPPGSESESGSRESSTETGAAYAVTVPSFNFGILTLGVYVVGAVLSGAAMILL